MSLRALHKNIAVIENMGKYFAYKSATHKTVLIWMKINFLLLLCLIKTIYAAWDMWKCVGVKQVLSLLSL